MYKNFNAVIWRSKIDVPGSIKEKKSYIKPHDVIYANKLYKHNIQESQIKY